MSTAIFEVFAPPPHEDFEPQELIDVPTTRERLDNIEPRLGVIEGHLGISREPAKRNSFWPENLAEWAQVVGTVFVILTAACGATLYLGSLMMDRRIQSALGPVNESVNQIKGDVREIRGALNVLQGQFTAQKYSTSAPKELQIHREELNAVKKNLAVTPRNVPNFWPVSFQIITLFSRATFDVEKVSQQGESTMDNVVSSPPGGIVTRENSRFLLRNLIQGITFKNSIIRFDPSVRLVNDVFIDCVFLFPVVETPPKPLQEIGTQLLASDLSKVTLNAS